jgi:hypothetical protein
MNRIVVVALLYASIATGCASHLSVRTEVYAGKDLVLPSSFPARAAERARATRQAMEALDTTIVMPVTDEFVRTLAVIKQTVPDAIAGTPEQFRSSYLTGIRTRVLQPLQPEIERVRSKAREIEARAQAGGGGDDLRAPLVELQDDLQQVIEGLQTRLTSVTQREEHLFVKAVRDAAGKLDAAALATATGLDVTNGGRAAAVDLLARRARVAFLDVSDAVGRRLLAPVEAAKTATAETLMLPLGDPNVPIIVGSPETHWRQFVNDVTSTNYRKFGVCIPHGGSGGEPHQERSLRPE